MADTDTLRETLVRIAELAGSAADAIGEGSGAEPAPDEPAPAPVDFTPCTLRALPRSLWLKAARTAVTHNPANRPALGRLESAAPGVEVTPAFIALLTSKYWGPKPRTLTVSFFGRPAADLRARIVSHMNRWSEVCCISFAETRGQGQVRISLGPGGYYSYLGTDILHIPANRQTMNLTGFSMRTPESEYRRVVYHETGHCLGFPHEHMRGDLVRRLDPQKTIDYFGRTQGWSASEVREQVLTPLEESSIRGTPADEDSIMCYQLPGSITRDGRPIAGGLDINALDETFAAEIYPKPGAAAGSGGEAGDEWPELPGAGVSE